MAVSLQSARPLKTLENALYVPRFVWVSLYGFWLDLMFYGLALLSDVTKPVDAIFGASYPVK